MSTGIVTKSTGSWYSVRSESGELIQCKIKGKFRAKGIKTTNPVAVGDKVDFIPGGKLEFAQINKIYPRKNYIIRKSINLSKQAHILAANVDQAILLVTLALPKTYPEFIDRFLVSAEAYQIPTKIVFNKIDLYDKTTLKEMDEMIAVYEKIGYQCLKISAIQGDGMDELDELLQNRLSVIAGHSGVGKSTLINKKVPGLNLKTNQISNHHEQGKHTTTFPEMFELGNNGYIIDTPGIKGFGVIDMDKEEIYHFFPEIFAISDKCQYYNCTHSHEPNCAVKEAVEENIISNSRYKSYIKLFYGEEDEKFRPVGY